jgi:hypothetical protein
MAIPFGGYHHNSPPFFNESKTAVKSKGIKQIIIGNDQRAFNKDCDIYPD